MAQHNLVCRGAAVAVGSVEVLGSAGNSVCVRLKVREDGASAPAQSPPPSLMIRPAAEDIFSSVSSWEVTALLKRPACLRSMLSDLDNAQHYRELKTNTYVCFFYSRLQLMICDALARVWMDADRKDRSLFCFHSLLQRLLVHLTSCRKLRCYNKKKLKWICVLPEFTFSIFAFMELNILTFNALAHAASRLPSLLISSSSSNMPVCLPGSSSGIIHWNILSEIWQELWMSTFFSPPPPLFLEGRFYVWWFSSQAEGSRALLDIFQPLFPNARKLQ